MRSTGTVHIRRAPLLLVAFFTILMLIGIKVDEPARVLEQAKTICLACIGLG